MPEEIGVYAWKEHNVREKVKDWYIKEMEQSKPRPEGEIGSDGEPDEQQGYGDPSNTGAESGIIKKIDAYQGDWKALLKKIITEHAELIGILKKYF